MSWINKDTEIYCSFAKNAGNTGCQMMNSAFYYYGLNKIYKSFSVDNIENAVKSVRTLNIKGFAITMPFKKEVLKYVDEIDDSAKIGAANTVINNNNKLKAYNTDFLAASDYLKRLEVDYANFYILGNGGYALAVKAAAEALGMAYINITRKNWEQLSNTRNSLIYNCTPVENLKAIIHNSNTIIDCLTQTDTGKQLASMQASYQFKLYTRLEFPIGSSNK
tara:strand:- start:426 stop:1088 length:663 start_codon:yes stop_codon:yes gene_type:complete